MALHRQLQTTQQKIIMMDVISEQPKEKHQCNWYNWGNQQHSQKMAYSQSYAQLMPWATLTVIGRVRGRHPQLILNRLNVKPWEVLDILALGDLKGVGDKYVFLMDRWEGA